MSGDFFTFSIWGLPYTSYTASCFPTSRVSFVYRVLAWNIRRSNTFDWDSLCWMKLNVKILILYYPLVVSIVGMFSLKKMVATIMGCWVFIVESEITCIPLLLSICLALCTFCIKTLVPLFGKSSLFGKTRTSTYIHMVYCLASSTIDSSPIHRSKIYRFYTTQQILIFYGLDVSGINLIDMLILHWLNIDIIVAEIICIHIYNI